MKFDRFFIKHAPVVIAASVLTLHTMGFLAEKYLIKSISLLLWFLVAIIDACFAFKCGKLVQKAFKDNLTDLNNRHYFFSTAAGEMERLKKGSSSLSLLMIDIDDFKQINDSYGHDIGDYVLKELADIFMRNVRKNDVAVRWGGEEFVLILPETDKDSAYKFAERIRGIVANHRFSHGPDSFATTISIGVAVADAASDVNYLTQLADTALYQAKRTKNVVVMI